MGEKMLVINPGSTSTKIAVYEGERETWLESINHTQDELKKFNKVYDQLYMRKNLILEMLHKHGDDLKSFDAIISRGGCVLGVSAGAYEVNNYMVECLVLHPVDQHPANVGAPIAYQFAKEINKKAYIYDAITVDEMLPINKVTGLKGMRRPSRGHNLNLRAAALKFCKDKDLSYKDTNIVVAHLGGGISVNLHSGGKMIDMIQDEEGPFSPERTGGLPCHSLVKLAFSGRYTEESLLKQIQRSGGMISWFDTSDMRQVEAMIDAGNTEAKMVFEAMALAVAKNIAKIAPCVNGKVDYIILTGGLAHSKRFTDIIKERIGFLAPVELIPGENEMNSLSQGVLRVLRGQEQAKLLTSDNSAGE